MFSGAVGHRTLRAAKFVLKVLTHAMWEQDWALRKGLLGLEACV